MRINTYQKALELAIANRMVIVNLEEVIKSTNDIWYMAQKNTKGEMYRWAGTFEEKRQFRPVGSIRFFDFDGIERDDDGYEYRTAVRLIPPSEQKKLDYFGKIDILKKQGIVEMGLKVKSGDKVIGLFWDGQLMNGTESEREEAEKYILPDVEYTVESIEIGSWCSTVVLKEYPKDHFNTVHFGIRKSHCAYEEECQHPACNCGKMIIPFKKTKQKPVVEPVSGENKEYVSLPSANEDQEEQTLAWRDIYMNFNDGEGWTAFANRMRNHFTITRK